jgi:eukaryotic-like serine/threonine-protein kinase
MVGTPAFCSPEQLRGEELNARSDMYSVGGTLFHLLTGRVPFEGQNIVQLTANVLEKPSPSPRGFRREIPKGLANVVLRCLAKQPTDRFKSYDDLRLALAPYSSTAPTPATLSLRFLAGLIDNLTVGLIAMAVMSLWFGNPMGWMTVISERSLEVRMVWIFGQFVAVLAYYTLFEGLWGAGVGKAVCRLRIVGPDKNPPGLSRALVRALLYLVLPSLPHIIVFHGDPKAAMTGSMVLQQLIGLSYYVILALLFCTARRRNGFAAVQDIVTKTQVISRTALERRPLLSAVETPPTAVDAKPSIGPYHVLETLETGADGQWLLGYDVRLLRKVWIRTVPPGAPPIAAPLRNIGRIGRLRWLTGRRSPEENWDAFEAVSGQPLLRLIQADRKTGNVPQLWRQVRFWLYDLAAEIAVAEKDGTLPETLSLDRVWITGDGRAKLLDFRAPGLVPTAKGDSPIFVDTKIGTVPMPVVLVPANGQRFLTEVAVAALEGRSDVGEKWVEAAAVPLPLHARRFLYDLPRHPRMDGVAAALRPLLRRTTAVSRLRRAAVIAGCAAFPVLGSCFLVVSMAMIRQLAPDTMSLFDLLQQRQIKNLIAEKNKGAADGQKEKTPTDRQFAVSIASHYRTTIVDKSIWESPIALALIRDDHRQFAERSIAEHPAPTKEEIADADAALEPCLRDIEMSKPRSLVLTMICLTVFVCYVCLPALIAAAAFRGGLILWMAGVTFVRRDGRRASRLRVFWRAIVAWSPLCAALPLVIAFLDKQAPVASSNLPIVLAFGVLLVLAIVSVVLPKRGLPDRLAGTWPVPR